MLISIVENAHNSEIYCKYKEMQRFLNIFFQMHFDVIMKKNLDKQHSLRIICQDPNIETHEAFMLMIIAH